MRAGLSEAAILRVVASLVAAERAVIGTGRAWDAAGWDGDTALGAAGLALDSLELLAASDVVGRLFRLHESGADNPLAGEATLGAWARVVRAALAGGAADGLTFATSGSTGLPKLCRRNLATLWDEAAFWRETLAAGSGRSAATPEGAEVGGGGRVIQTVAAHHIYGFLFTVMLPELTGWPVLDARMMLPDALRAALRPGDLLVGFPTGLARLLRSAECLPAGLLVVSATASLPAWVHERLRAIGAADVIDVYGSTETGGIGFRRDPAAAFALLPRWRRGDGDRFLADTGSGVVVDLPDHVTWEGERLLRPAARVDGAVQVAGVNVFPEQVAARLCRLAVVAECRVELDTELAEPRLRAWIVAQAGVDGAAAVAACAGWAARHLTAPERPVGFGILESDR